MRVGPSEPPYRWRLQTTLSCWWVRAHSQHKRCIILTVANIIVILEVGGDYSGALAEASAH
ncbi:MAG: hypothetical protein DDT33_01189 [Firmicutes bacterium]|nr:hypothetical protein [Bacillota bacterium]